MTATLQCHQHFQRTRCASLCTEIAGVNPVTQQLYHITRTHTHNHYTGNAVLLGVHSFILLWAGVQPTVDHSAETFILVQCASPGSGGELVGVCGVCACCVGWRKEQ